MFKIAAMTRAQVSSLRDELLSAKQCNNKMKIAQLKRKLVTKCDPTDDEVMEIIKAVYGDPTAGRQFYQLWRKIMLKMGMKQGTTESCFWYNNTETLGTLYVLRNFEREVPAGVHLGR